MSGVTGNVARGGAGGDRDFRAASGFDFRPADVSRMAEIPLEVRLALVDAVRAAVDQLATSSASDDVLARAAELVDQGVSVLAEGPHHPGWGRILDGVLSGLGPHGEVGPFVGALHAFAPPAFDVTVEPVGGGNVVTGTVAYGDAYEGAPGYVQGGFIVATFDEILGLAQAGSGRLTVRIDISYRSPALLHRKLRYTARVDRVEGRKAFVVGALHDGERLCAEAQGIFVAPGPRPGSV